jgi:hypothetical protein
MERTPISNDLPGCGMRDVLWVVGGVTDTTQPRARPGSGRPSSRSRGYHLGMARAPPPPPPRLRGRPRPPRGVPTDSWGPGGGLTTPATPFSNYASLTGGTSLRPLQTAATNKRMPAVLILIYFLLLQNLPSQSAVCYLTTSSALTCYTNLSAFAIYDLPFEPPIYTDSNMHLYLRIKWMRGVMRSFRRTTSFL